MERRRRVYQTPHSREGWLSGLLLFLSAIVVLSGLVWRGEKGDISIRLAPSPTPIPLNEAFDETQVETDISLKGSEWYALQLGVFENPESAARLAEEYSRRGAAGYVWHDGRYRTLAAVYASKEDAQNVRQQLSKQHDVETYLYTISYPAIEIRLSGMQGQVEILQAAFLHGEEMIVLLQEMSMALDRQEKNAAEVKASLNGMNDQLTAVALRMRQRFAAPRHETVSALLKCFENYSGFVSSIDSIESEVALGTKLKYQTFSSLDSFKQVYDSLNNT